MKKEYKKPQVIYESFELSQSIAGECDGGISNAQRGICPVFVEDLGQSIFSDETICDIGVPPGYEDRFCYHAPGDSSNVYSS